MYIPKDTAEMRSILEALRTYASLQGMQELSELLGDVEIALAMEELQSGTEVPQTTDSPTQENPLQG